MKCVSPISLKTKEGRTHVPCGTCIHCLTKRQQDWSFRLGKELKIAKTSSFVTLTYDDIHVPVLETHNQDGELIYQTQLSKSHLQLFMKRLRDHQLRTILKYRKLKNFLLPHSNLPKIRYYAVGEYGTNTKRPHYHILLFNIDPFTLKNINQIWGKGHVDIGNITPKSITYVTKYVINSRNQYYGQRQKQFSTMSKQPGIGANYLQDSTHWHRANSYHHVINSSGNKQALPDYYKNKIFTKYERENHRLKNEQNIIDKELAQDLKHVKNGNNPYTMRQNQTERKQKKHDKNSKNNPI